MSSMLSAPAIMPATRAGTFKWAFTGQHRAQGHRKDLDQGMTHTATTPRIGDLAQHVHQAGDRLLVTDLAGRQRLRR